MRGSMPYQSIDPKASIDSVKLGAAFASNRSAGTRQPMSNNYVNRSLQGGLPTQADSLSYAAGGQNVPNMDEINAAGLNESPLPTGEVLQEGEQGVSLSNLLTNIKVQRPAGLQ